MANSDYGQIATLALDDASEARGLAAIIRSLTRARSQEEIIAVMNDGVRTVLKADGAGFARLDGDHCQFGAEDVVSPLWRGRRLPLNACLTGWCILNRRPAAVLDVNQDARVATQVLRPTFARSVAAAPVGRDAPIGALGVYWAEARQVPPEDLALLQSLADAMALAMTGLHRAEAAAPAAVSEARQPRRPTPPTGRPVVHDFISRVRRDGLRHDSLEAYAFAVACVLAATLLRVGVKAIGVHGLVIYSTYYPAAVLAMLVGGRRAGLLAAALGGLAAYWFFMPPLYKFVPLMPADLLNLTLYGGSCALIILIIDRYQRAVLWLQKEDIEHLTLAREQLHRLHNAVSVVQAVVRQSLHDQPERAAAINRRVRAGLADVHLPDVIDEPTNLRSLLNTELQAFDLARFDLEGEGEQPLAAKARHILTLAVHELATNALKYGALSVQEGRVKVRWRIRNGPMTVIWREVNGPLVQPPRRRGYGSILLRRLIEAAGGTIAIDFHPTGVAAEISLPV